MVQKIPPSISAANYSFDCLAPIKPEMPAASDFLDSSSDIGNFSRCPASFLSNQKQKALLSSHDSTIIHGPFRGATRTTSPCLKSAIGKPPIAPSLHQCIVEIIDQILGRF